MQKIFPDVRTADLSICHTASNLQPAGGPSLNAYWPQTKSMKQSTAILYKTYDWNRYCTYLRENKVVLLMSSFMTQVGRIRQVFFKDSSYKEICWNDLFSKQIFIKATGEAWNSICGTSWLISMVSPCWGFLEAFTLQPQRAPFHPPHGPGPCSQERDGSILLQEIILVTFIPVETNRTCQRSST